MTATRWAIASLSLALAACAGLPSVAPSAGSAGTENAGPIAPNPRIAPPAGSRATLQLRARGVQVFRCEQDAAGWYWVFQEPQAQLFDAANLPVGRHRGGFAFEHADGSRLAGEVSAWQDAPGGDGDLKWLLIGTRSSGKGVFAGVSHVQRINTQGGQPLAGCTAAQARQTLRVPFEADFVFYRPR